MGRERCWSWSFGFHTIIREWETLYDTHRFVHAWQVSNSINFDLSSSLFFCGCTMRTHVCALKQTYHEWSWYLKYSPEDDRSDTWLCTIVSVPRWAWRQNLLFELKITAPGTSGFKNYARLSWLVWCKWRMYSTHGVVQHPHVGCWYHTLRTADLIRCKLQPKRLS